MIRILGESRDVEVAAALADAGVDAAYVGAPSGKSLCDHAGADTDLLVGDVMASLDRCWRIKWTERSRPVVAVVPREFEHLLALKVLDALGPDAYVVRPPSSNALKDAIARAKAQAGSRRPYLSVRTRPELLLVLAGCLLALPVTVSLAEHRHATPAQALMSCVGMILAGSGTVVTSRRNPVAFWSRRFGFLAVGVGAAFIAMYVGGWWP